MLVIEHGGTDAGPFIRMPGALSYPMNMRRYDWGYVTEPEPHMNGRRMACPRGKVIGGSSSINGMIYVRGHAHDFDTWAEMGADGWAYADVLPYFRRLETLARDRGAMRHGAARTDRCTSRGVSRKTRFSMPLPEAGAAAGYGRTEDYNGERQEGFGAFERHDLARPALVGGRTPICAPRSRAATARFCAASVDRIEIAQGRASGVRLSDGRLITARGEIVLATGAINSPKILMTSGIGPAKHLGVENGIPVVADRPGVGARTFRTTSRCTSSSPQGNRSASPLTGRSGARPLVGAQWVAVTQGAGCVEPVRGLRLQSAPARGFAYPDIQFHFLPIAVRYDGSTVAQGHGFQAHVGPMRFPQSGGVSALRGPDPANAALDPVQLHEPRAGLGGVPPRHPPDARDHGTSAHEAFRGRRDPARRACL